MKFYGRAEEVAQSIIELFESGNLPEPLATTYLIQGVPMCEWSKLNQLSCLAAGCSDARGFKQWGKVGRSITKGEKAKTYILIPMFREKKEKNDDEKGNGRYLWAFKSCAVFDVSQTNGEPLPEIEERREFIQGLPLLEVARSFGLDVSIIASGNGQALGFFSSTHQQIGVGVENLLVWFHELIHAADSRLGNLVEEGQHWRSETIAELGGSVLAYLLGLEHDADLGGSWRYIKAYATRAGIQPITACTQVLTRVDQAISLIIETAQQIQEKEPCQAMAA